MYRPVAVPSNRNSNLKLSSFGARLHSMHRRWIGVLVCLVLLTCIVSPFVEIAVHSNGSILDGQDNESTVAVLALCVALAVAAASLVLVYCVGTNCEALALSHASSYGAFPTALATIDSGTSPPIALRI